MFEQIPSNRIEESEEKEKEMEELPERANWLRQRALELREEIRRQEEFEQKLSAAGSDEERFGLMKRQQEAALERSRREFEKLRNELKSIFGVELPK